MYRIGLFSQITKVSVKALRFYEEKGLLVPAFSDPATGYRYYDSDQLFRVHRILALRQCSFSIDDIRSILAGKNAGRLLTAQKKKLEQTMKDTAAQLASITSYIDCMQHDPIMNYQGVVKPLPCVTVYSGCMTAQHYSDFFELIPKIQAEAFLSNPDIKLKDDPPYCFIRYLDKCFKETDIKFEYCEAVCSPGKTTENITFKTIESVPRAACVMHKGSYDGLPLAYGAVFKWIDDNGFIPGAPRESEIDGVWNKKSPEDWLTEIQVPIE
jgi:DNA-binding transcriptional MerR regulator/effector-binding domain-containing protein